MLPLQGITVLEFSQFMAGPSAGLKLADLGARVIKIERPQKGESGRQIAIKNLFIENDSLVFHTINRNKESYTANLKDPEALAKVKQLIAKADIMTHNFRPGIMEKIGLDYDTVSKINPRIIYGEVTGYGKKGPWSKKPGQDLLIQSLSGINFLTGNEKHAPTPMGIAAVDMFTGAHLAQGILAVLYQSLKTNKGAKVSVSLLESALDIQFEVLTTYLNDTKRQPKRAKQGNANAFLAAPYGIYKTADSYLSLAMVPLDKLFEVLQEKLPVKFQNQEDWFHKKDEIMEYVSSIFIRKTTSEWLSVLEPEDIWCSDVYNYEQLLNHEAYKILEMDQTVETIKGEKVRTTRCPIRIDHQQIFSTKSAPKVGEHTALINQEFNLN
ncbi:CaiB/BaiF CoA transferase family protein [Tenacibaculum agarivorans]|uniref:CaiB/BaiF CoA transferase family protein n=1 Tax=Tenacibaculum agarivorans TaxID=1908389 RepID=UPI00094BA6B3|nr:CoA transferase [Tenacibaculum agarivorans]